ncbi:MAG TPA: tetratricopeptide repeat protein [Kofleriaceae bacterium]|jgi:hypothetical protein
MSCLSDARIAAAASGDDVAASEHAAACIRCRRLIAEAEATRAQLKLVRVMELAVARRASLRAELLARRDAASARRARRPWAAALAIVAALAVGALVVIFASHAATQVALVPPVIEPVDTGAQAPALPPATTESVGLPPPPVADGLVTGAGRFERDGDAVQLTDGSITIDSQGRRATQVVLRRTRVTVDGARIKITASGGNIVQIVVFAGSVEVERDGHVQVIESGELWRPAPKQAAPVNAAAVRSPAVDAFHRGWTALQAKSYADAIAAFDEATDPAVAEDASFWAATAAARAGDSEEARRRLRIFVATYPESPHADSARAELSTPLPPH